MIHYHGTPLTPRSKLETLKGKHFCVSFQHNQDAKWCIDNAQSIMWDNGAYTAYKKGRELSFNKYYNWLDDKLCGSNWAVIPDVIDGTESQQRELLEQWPYQKYRGCAVWHMGLSIDYLLFLCDNYSKVAFGSSGQYWKVKSPEWCSRADEAWNAIEKQGSRPYVHMMRGLSVSGCRWPFASADSTNVARNFKENKRTPLEMINIIDSKQTPMRLNSDNQTSIS